VAHTCNPGYSGGRDQEDCGSKLARQIVPETLSQKSFTKIGLVKWLKVKALSSSTTTTKKKNPSRTHLIQVYAFRLKVSGKGRV
jgi:hypothetical protein